MWTHIRFPSQTMVLLSRDVTDFTKQGNSQHATHSHLIGPYIFRVANSMNKLEIKEYLQKIYNVRVTRVNTSNMLGIRMLQHSSSPRKGLSIHQNHHPERTRLEEGLRIHRSQLSPRAHHNARSQRTADERLSAPFLHTLCFISLNEHILAFTSTNTYSHCTQHTHISLNTHISFQQTHTIC